MITLTTDDWGSLLANGHPFHLRGVNWHGAENHEMAVPFGLGSHSIDWWGSFMRTHGINAVRLHFTHAGVLQNAKIAHVNYITQERSPFYRLPLFRVF